ncbi:MAG: hypothetical protein K1X53_05920, partial [Candidatus Sumerlaeaceae bacterium]|nr:hypothetical protein [Candidatus Sumerlaeaceae bacterium]
TYRTLTSAVNTGTAGSSLGGIISTFMGLDAPETFAKIGALSPAYWVNLNVVNRLTTDASLPNWRHYLDSGTTGGTSEGSPDGYARCFDVRDRMLNRGQVLNVNVYHAVGFGQQHDETAWQSRFPQTARFLFPIEDESSSLPVAGANVADWNYYP